MEQRLIFNSRDELLRIDVSKIVYLEADGNYTSIMTINKIKGYVKLNLGQMEKALAEQLKEKASTFMRIGKRFVVNRSFIYKINIPKQQLILSDFDHFAFHVPISKEALRELKDVILKSKF